MVIAGVYSPGRSAGRSSGRGCEPKPGLLGGGGPCSGLYRGNTWVREESSSSDGGRLGAAGGWGGA